MTQGFAAVGARASHPSLGDQLVEGSLYLGAGQLRFDSPGFQIHIPLVRLEISLDEAAPEQVCFSDSDQPEGVIFCQDSSILSHPVLLQQTCTRNQIRALQSRGELKRRLLLTGYFLLGFALLALLVSQGLSLMVRSLVRRIPAAWEQDLGTKLLGEAKEAEVFVEDPKRMARLSAAVAPLLSALPKNTPPVKLYLVQNPLPNAFALPGGHVVVHTGLIDLADTPEELAGVVAHEVAHVTRRHIFRKILSTAGPYLVFRFFMGDSGGLLGAVGKGSEVLVRQSFSQEYELEADATGWQYLVDARIDPRGMIEILRKLKLEQEHLSAMDLGAFGSHPATAKRIARLEAKWEQLPNKTAFEARPPSE